MTFDLSAIQRRLKPARRTLRLRRRAAEDLPFASESTVPKDARVLLDTCVYIDIIANRLPAHLDQFLSGRPHHHSSVCLAELTYALGALDPTDSRTPERRRLVESIVAGIAEDDRTVTPDDHAWATAGILAGILRRTQDYGPEQRRKALSDSLLFVSALRNGLTLLTANVAEFDLLQQLLPEGRVAFYRPL